MTNNDVAFLVFRPLRKRRKDESFDGNDNIGALVVKSVIESNGVSVGFCSAETAHEYKLVLVSFTSTHDVFAFYQSVALLPSWQPGKRTFKVLAGGFGMQNPTSIRNYIDYAAFGRVEDWIFPIVDAILGGGIPQEHPSLMFLPDLQSVEFHQVDHLYQEQLQGKTPYGETFIETFTGCPLKCKFCHYTYARKYQDTRETRGSYVQTSLTGGGTPELTFDQLFTYGKKIGRARVAIDGMSERLRWLYGKKISNDDIVNGIECVGQYEGNTVLLVYNIGNFPYETERDRQELYDTMKRVSPKNRVVFVLHTTPFRPSLGTPMQWEGVALQPDWSKKRTGVMAEHETFRAVHSFTLETPYSHLSSVVAERATPQTDKLFHTMAFNRFLNSARHDKRLMAVQKEFDISQYVKEYEIGDASHPAWFIESYIKKDVMVKIATKMRREAQDGNYKLKGKSIVAARLGLDTS